MPIPDAFPARLGRLGKALRYLLCWHNCVPKFAAAILRTASARLWPITNLWFHPPNPSLGQAAAIPTTAPVALLPHSRKAASCAPPFPSGPARAKHAPAWPGAENRVPPSDDQPVVIAALPNPAASYNNQPRPAAQATLRGLRLVLCRTNLGQGVPDHARSSRKPLGLA